MQRLSGKRKSNPPHFLPFRVVAAAGAVAIVSRWQAARGGALRPAQVRTHNAVALSAGDVQSDEANNDDHRRCDRHTNRERKVPLVQ